MAGTPVVRQVTFDTVVSAATAHRIVQAIDDAEQHGEDLVLIELDTPGGEVEAMQGIVKRMLASKVPIAVWVGPPGAHAASAGLFILVAADVAAMAPGTRTGASSTVLLLSGESKSEDVLLKKSNEDLAAWIRSVAQHRGRNVAACEAAVFEAKAYEESVALERGLIDLVVRDRAELLERLEGREVRRFDGQSVTLHTAGARLVTSESTASQRLLEFLGHPIVAFLLLVIGLVGLYAEFNHPGLIFPAVAGASCLILFAFSAQVLPISWLGFLLIVVGVVLFVLELKIVSHGMLTIGGLVCLALGASMLVDGPIPEMRVPPAVYLPATLVAGAFCAFVVRLVAHAQRGKIGTGAEGLADEVGTVVRALDPEGKVAVHGELWDAAVDAGRVPEGARVRVVRVQDLRLTVEPVDAAQVRGS